MLNHSPTSLSYALLPPLIRHQNSAYLFAQSLSLKSIYSVCVGPSLGVRLYGDLMYTARSKSVKTTLQYLFYKAGFTKNLYLINKHLISWRDVTSLPWCSSRLEMMTANQIIILYQISGKFSSKMGWEHPLWGTSYTDAQSYIIDTTAWLITWQKTYLLHGMRFQVDKYEIFKYYINCTTCCMPHVACHMPYATCRLPHVVRNWVCCYFVKYNMNCPFCVDLTFGSLVPSLIL